MRLQNVQRMQRSATRKAFTLMELLVVIAILLVLAAVATPLYLSYLEQSRYDKVKAEVQTLAQDIKQWNLRNRDRVGFELPAGDWSAIQLEKGSIIDPWGTPYQFDYARVPDQINENLITSVPVVWSIGPGKNLGPGDELSSAPNLAIYIPRRQ